MIVTMKKCDTVGLTSIVKKIITLVKLQLSPSRGVF